jgi:hypothetical protein
MLSSAQKSPSGSSHFGQWVCLAGVIIISLLSFGFTLLEGIFNFDFHHPGLMFIPAQDLYHGFKPFKEIVILYGYLSTYIQSLAIMVFGETYLSIWIVTGLFYAASLWLSYQVFRYLLTPLTALLTTGFLFLLHPYALYPWPNYYWYFFILLTIWCLIKVLPQDDGIKLSQRQQATWATLSGMALGAAWLCRYSAVMPTLAPIVLFFMGEWAWNEKSQRRHLLRLFQWIILGGLTVFVIFTGYCLDRGVLADSWSQSKIATEEFRAFWLTHYGYQGGSETLFLAGVVLQKMLQSLQTFSQNLRLAIMSLNFFIIVGGVATYIILKIRSSTNLNSTDRVAFLLSLFAIFAYTNAHVYEIFRLANGAAIEFGVISYGLLVRLPQSCQCQIRWRRIYQFGLATLFAILATVWLKDLLPLNQRLGMSYWDTTKIWPQPSRQGPIPALVHQRFNPITVNYEEIADILKQYDSSFIVVNDTNDSNLTLLSDKPKAYLMPAYITDGLRQRIGDQARAQSAIASGKAIILTFQENNIPPGYQEVRRVRFRERPKEWRNAILKILAKTRPDRLQ